MKRCKIVLLLLVGWVCVMAQTDSLSSSSAEAKLHTSPVRTQVRMLGIGSAEILDTYLSPEDYNGFSLRYIAMNEWADKRNDRFTHRFTHEGMFSRVRNRADNNSELGGQYFFRYALLHQWTIADGRLRFFFGGEAEATTGFLYNTRNQNNPAQARLSLHIAPMTGVDYRFLVGKRPCRLQYEASVPLVGMMFSPNYGQSYYELFNCGNYDHNLVFTTVGSVPSLRQQLAFDFPVSRFYLRVGYLGDYRQASVNGLKYHEYSHSLLVGIVSRFSITHFRL